MPAPMTAVTVTEPPIPPIEDNALRAFWTLAVGPTPPEAGTLNARAPVVTPLKFRAKEPLVPMTCTVCCSALGMPSAVGVRMRSTPSSMTVRPPYDSAVGKMTVPPPAFRNRAAGTGLGDGSCTSPVTFN